MRRRSTEEGQQQDDHVDQFYFVVKNPSSRADTSKNRTAVKSQITKNYWRQTRPGYGGKTNTQRNRTQKGSVLDRVHAQRLLRPSGSAANEYAGDPRPNHSKDLMIRSPLEGTNFPDQSHAHNGGNALSNVQAGMTDDIRTAPSPITFLGPGSEDPFQSYPSTLRASSVASLTHHCKYSAKHALYYLWRDLKAHSK